MSDQIKKEKRSRKHVIVNAPNVRYTMDRIMSIFKYQMGQVVETQKAYKTEVHEINLKFRLQRKPGKTGVMLVGWGGNNGSTFTAALLAAKQDITWEGPKGQKRRSDWLGSFTQSSTAYLGQGTDGQEVYVPWNSLVPLVDAEDIEIGGWDISKTNLREAVKRAGVLDIDLQNKLAAKLQSMEPLPSIYNPEFIAQNQEERANNTLTGSMYDMVQKVQCDILDFKRKFLLDTVVVIWSANTEKMTPIITEVNDTADNLTAAIINNHPSISPSTLFSVAAINVGSPFINGSPQNTFVPGVLDLAEKNGVFVAGNDFKTGQTKFKSSLVEFLIGAGIKPMSIMSFNHLGNNDGKNLSSQKQFEAKEVSKTNVIEDMISSNPILYNNKEKPVHEVVIKYNPYVGDSKHAMDEYISEIMMGGQSTITVHNVCEDSLLAAPLILDLVILTEFFGRLLVSEVSKGGAEEVPLPLNTTLSALGYFLKAPLVKNGAPVINALSKQRSCLENLMRACIGLHPVHNLHLESKVRQMTGWPYKTVESEMANEEIVVID